MIRPVTMLAALLAMLSGAYLFAVKHRAQVLDDQLAAVTEQSRLDGQRIRVLQAQWALEIDPTRLNQLAARFTTLQPMRPAQLVTVAALRALLPPPGAPAPGANPESSGAPDDAAYDTLIAQNGLPLPPPVAPDDIAPSTILAAAAAPQASAAPFAPPTDAPATDAPATDAEIAQTGSRQAPAALPAGANIAAPPARPPRPVRRSARPVQLAQNMRAVADGGTAPAYQQPYQPYQPSRPVPAVAVQAVPVMTPVAAAPAASPFAAAPAAGSMLGSAGASPPPPRPLGAN